jgi:TPR repeat protein
MNVRGQLSKSILILVVATACVLTAQEPDDSNPAAMAELARKYEKGLGCPRDIGKALVYYKRSASLGEPTAMVALGDLYHEGVCVPPDLKYATDMFRQAADKGFAPGMMRYGEILESSGRRPEGMVWVRRAAMKGYGPAMTKLGDVLADVEWYRRAVAAKHPPAFARLAENVPSTEAVELLRQGAELGDPTAQSRYARRIEATDRAKAIELYRAAAPAGDAVAMSRLGFYSETEGDKLLWYTKAAEAGDGDALYWMARRAENSGNKDEALRLYRRAVGKGHTGATAQLAKLTGDKTMLKAAAEAGDADALYSVAKETGDQALMKRAAELGHVEALAATGQTEKAAAKGHIPSLLKLERWEEAAKAGSPEGLYRYGLSLTDKADGTRYIRRAAEASYPAAMRELAFRLESGNGAAANVAESKQWFERAAKAGDPVAMYKLGDESSVRQAAAAGYAPAMVKAADLTGDRTWLEKAAAANYVPAYTKLGQYEKAADAGDPEAIVALADKTKSPQKAYKLYLEAADKGYLPAMRRLAECHINGRGTSLSEIDGINWYRKAAQAGDAESLAKLKQLGKTLY